MVPIYAEESEAGDMIYGFGPDDYERIRQGYACPHCLEIFGGDQPISLLKCPVCKRTTALDAGNGLTQAPQDWVDYLKYREKVLSEPATRRR